MREYIKYIECMILLSLIMIVEDYTIIREKVKEKLKIK